MSHRPVQKKNYAMYVHYSSINSLPSHNFFWFYFLKKIHRSNNFFTRNILSEKIRNKIIKEKNPFILKNFADFFFTSSNSLQSVHSFYFFIHAEKKLHAILNFTSKKFNQAIIIEWKCEIESNVVMEGKSLNKFP